MNNSNKIINLLKEPLLHFLLIGAALFLFYGWRGNPISIPGGQMAISMAPIVISRDSIEQINSQFVKTWMRPPTEEEQKRLIEDLVRNEIYYREAIAIGLDRDDEVLKRRMRQRMEFIMEDVTSRLEPTDEDLKAFMKKHPENYLIDPQLSFRQVYVNYDKRGKNAESDALQILAQLSSGADPDSVGDPFLLESEIKLSPLWDISKQFGERFSKSLLDLKPGRWEGPIHSEYGTHLVFVKKRVGGRLPELKEVREALKRDWAYEHQKELKDAAYAKIRERYSVTVEGPKTEATTPAAASTKAVVR
jgi:hypothetical protein